MVNGVPAGGRQAIYYLLKTTWDGSRPVNYITQRIDPPPKPSALIPPNGRNLAARSKDRQCNFSEFGGREAEGSFV